MTVRDWLEARAASHGLWQAEAEAVIAQIAGDDNWQALADALDKAAEGYPKQFLAVAWMTFESEALKWIDANKPKHWARPMFDHGQPSGGVE